MNKIISTHIKSKLILANLPNSVICRDLNIPKLGLGTIRYGRDWPKNKTDNKMLTQVETNTNLNTFLDAGVMMVDTAACYGISEEKLGNFFKEKTYRHYLNQVFIATKWGLVFNPSNNGSDVNHSIRNLHESFRISSDLLPRVDLFYTHKANAIVLCNTGIKNTLLKFQSAGKIKWIGASITKTDDFSEVFHKRKILSNYVQFIQTGPEVLDKYPDMIKTLHKEGIAIVINSPFSRNQSFKSGLESYKSILKNPNVSFVLMSSNKEKHIQENLDLASIH